MFTYKLTIAYDGSRFFGWQKQDNRRTVQGELESALNHLTGEKMRVIGASRTDRGVHAHAQIAHFNYSKKIDTKQFIEVLNSITPEDICIKALCKENKNFHSRFDACKKVYSYNIVNSLRKPVFDPYCMWVKRPLNISDMQKAAKLFSGKKNFAFVGKRDDRIVSEICSLNISKLQKRGSRIKIIFSGDHFLWNMVRNIVGAMVNAGAGKFTIEQLRKMVRSKELVHALRKPAPAKGLFLEKIYY